MAEPLVVRSYRRVFRVDRRIYRVDRWTLPVPGGVPLRGAAYFAAALVLVVLASGLPGVGALVGELSPPLRFVVLPLGVAMLGTQAAPDGRAAHRFARDWLAFRLRARRRCAGRPVALEGEVTLVGGVLSTTWDEHSPRLRRARVHGPAAVRFAVPVELIPRRRGLLARRRGEGSAGTVVIGGGAPLEVRP